MADTKVVEETAQLIAEKLEALDKRTSDEALLKLIDERLADYEPDDEFVRKIRHAGGDGKLKGSKFGRMGLWVGDIERLF
ncbi:hypothetical protein LCGC14_2608500, partial [marine sediment metagenome]